MGEMEHGPEYQNEQSLTIEPRHALRILFTRGDEREIKHASTEFGNSGVYISISEGSLDRKPEWGLHFAPEHQTQTLPAKTDEDWYNKTKYGRMFAAGMLSLIGYFNSNSQKFTEPEIEYFYKNFQTSKLDFFTNKSMLDFARKMFGDKYFSESKANKGSEMHYASFLLSDFLNDLKQNPKLLEVAKKFADPNKLKEIKVLE